MDVIKRIPHWHSSIVRRVIDFILPPYIKGESTPSSAPDTNLKKISAYWRVNNYIEDFIYRSNKTTIQSATPITKVFDTVDTVAENVMNQQPISQSIKALNDPKLAHEIRNKKIQKHNALLQEFEKTIIANPATLAMVTVGENNYVISKEDADNLKIDSCHVTVLVDAANRLAYKNEQVWSEYSLSPLSNYWDHIPHNLSIVAHNTYMKTSVIWIGKPHVSIISEFQGFIQEEPTDSVPTSDLDKEATQHDINYASDSNS